MCRLLNVAKSGYYAFRSRPSSSRPLRDEAMTLRIRELHAENLGCYGSPRVLRALKAEGVSTSRKRVARLMKQAGLKGKKKGRYVATTITDTQASFPPNLVGRKFTASEPNRVWVSDVTALWTMQGWLYLSVILDLYSRRVVGWSTGRAVTTELCARALVGALADRRPPPGLVHHSDRGVTYGSTYRELLREHEATASMSRRANCWDNAVAESFFASMKAELGISKYSAFDTVDAAKETVLRYIEGFYNSRRLHSTLGYVSPKTYEEVPHAARAA